MKISSTRVVAICATLLLSGNALANDNIWVGLKAGTLGLGIEASWRPIPWLDVRAGANQYDYDDSGSQAGINYDATLGLETYYAPANFRFPLSPFRMTLGAFSNANEVEMTSMDMPAYTIGDNPIPYLPTEVGTLRSSTTFDSVSPYLGAGFDFDIVGRLGLSLDFGVLWQGEPIVGLTADGTLATDPGPAGDLFRASLEAERVELEKEVEDMKAYPVIQIGFNFNF